jgi:putative NADH-flavin reductase
MKTIALFGATGKTGSILLKKLVAKGYSVKVLVRNPAKLTFTDSLITVLQGDILDVQSVYNVVEKSDAVINVIGHVKGCPPDLQTVASRNILESMKKFGLTRLMSLTGGGVAVNGDNPGILDKSVVFVMKNLAGKSAKNRLVDGENHVKMISKSSIDWTIIRAPVLLPGNAKGKTCIGLVGHIPGITLTFEDLTNKMIQILEDKSYIRQYPYITNC